MRALAPQFRALAGEPTTLIDAASNQADRTAEPALFTLEKVLVTPSHNELAADGKTLRLQPKVMEVLCYLARNQQRVISNDELTEQVWQGRVVTPGSVQKSINLLRKAFAKLLGEREVIVHFSKRGYQLQIEPVYLQEAPPRVASASPFRRIAGLGPKQKLLVVAGVLLLISGLAAMSYLYTHRHTLLLDKSHQTLFDSLHSFTSEVGHERGAEPHPNGRHLAYIVAAVTAEGAAMEARHLVIRDDAGRDWWFADAAGSWRKLDWSPDGRHLVAVELVGEEGGSNAGFYSTAAQLFDIHVFELDLQEQRVLGTHRLSHWHGHISSVTWWDNDTIEIVGKQGEALVNHRYRYSLGAQQLDSVPPLDFVINPLLTSVHNGRTAVASLHWGATRIDFLTRDQVPFASHLLPYRATDLSWIPDGSGVLVHAEEARSLSIVYRNGQRLDLQYPYSNDTRVADFRFSADGRKLYFTQERPRANLWLQPLTGSAVNITDNRHWNYAGSFSPSGDRIAYVSVRNNQPQIWLVADGRERQLSRGTLDRDIDAFVWSRDADSLLFRAGETLYRHSVALPDAEILWTGARNLVPLTYLNDSRELLVIRYRSDVRNLWRLNTASGEERQLTFGSLGAVIAHEGDVYFQYTGQSGLWRWRAADDELELVTRNLEPNSRFLHVNRDGIYYVTGGECHESDIYLLNLDTSVRSTVLDRSDRAVSSLDFHPAQGVLYSRCQLQEADIMMLE